MPPLPPRRLNGESSSGYYLGAGGRGIDFGALVGSGDTHVEAVLSGDLALAEGMLSGSGGLVMGSSNGMVWGGIVRVAAMAVVLFSERDDFSSAICRSAWWAL